MKIAVLTKYGDLAASTRQRHLQYLPFLTAEGLELLFLPLLDNIYLEGLYNGEKHKALQVATRYLDRLLWLLARPDVDVIWLNRELFPFLPGLMERLARLPARPIVYDFDDAIFHNYDQHRNGLVRRVLGTRLHSTISGADLAFCGNAYLAEYARPLCARVEIVPTVLDTAVYNPRYQTNVSCAPVHIGWIGSPSTWSEYMLPMMPLLTNICDVAGGRIVAVGAGHAADSHPLLDNLPWTEASEVANLHSMDIGIMPLNDTPWARGKCGYKLIQYMACGIPVVASPVGANSEIVEHGVNGFLASSKEEWTTALNTLIHDPNLRARMGREGRSKVERDYSLQVWGPRVATMLRGVAERGRS